PRCPPPPAFPPDRRPHPAATSPAVDESAIRADRELLADLARMNSDVVPLAMRIVDDCGTNDGQSDGCEH
ncbi:MAG: hypothetical protein ACRDTT_12435, partial [Pseudonocardiaceae bacterium]